ncbi:Flavin prenyltransferase UbiX [hydrothermal vent metagenome]|uniref:flavin prenyltransferase n=1 Tax=hydrothermal vent metagenome TaxID=652676 RepID=A0A3B1BG85_9ZZZZ
MKNDRNRLIVGITGASGVIYGIRLLECLKKYAANVETRLIISPSAEKNIGIETDYAIDSVKELADVVDEHNDFTAPVSSGSFKTRGMIVAPCSIRTLSNIANSNNNNLLVRTADVALKEGRKLVLVPRESPLHKGHLELMTKVADIGAIILPPMPAFYHSPKTIDDIIDHTVGKVLDQFDIEHDLFKRWG